MPIKLKKPNLKKILFRQDGQKQLQTPKGETAEFLVRHDNLDVGYLILRDEKWHFEYTDSFRENKDIRPIIDFPHLDKRYESDVLWPFFLIRIPGLKQPAIQKMIEDGKLDPSNEVQLLKRFGETTIANPFTLIPKGPSDESED